MSGILLIGIILRPSHTKDKGTPKHVTFFYQIFGVGIFSLGLILIYLQWFGSRSIVFSDSQMCMHKIQKLYQLSIDSAQEKDFFSQKEYIISAIELTEEAVNRTPLDSDLHFIKGKLLSLLEGYDDEAKSSFELELKLDPYWVDLPLRQSEIWLYIDIKHTLTLWVEALKRAEKIDQNYVRLIWKKILDQAKRQPIQMRDVYNIILDRDDPYYINLWMEFAGSKNRSMQIPKILQSDFLRIETKENILNNWKSLYESN